MAALNPKQASFVSHYLVSLNATAAAEKAGYKHPNKQGPALLVNLGVSAAIAVGRQKQQARLQIDSDTLTRELARVGLSDPRRLFKPDGTLKPVAEWDDDLAAAVGSIELKDGTISRVRLWDKVSALDKLLKRFDLYPKLAPRGDPENPLHVVLTLEQRRSILDRTLDTLRERAGIAGPDAGDNGNGQPH